MPAALCSPRPLLKPLLDIWIWVTEQEEASGVAVTATESGGAAEGYLSVIPPLNLHLHGRNSRKAWM